MAIGQELLNVPMGDMIRQMAFAIAEGQAQLDASSIEVAEMMGGLKVIYNDEGEMVFDDSRVFFGYEVMTIEEAEAYVAAEQAFNETSAAPISAVLARERKPATSGGPEPARVRVPTRMSMLELGFTPNFYQFVDTIIEVRIAIKITRNTESTVTSRNTRQSTSRYASGGGLWGSIWGGSSYNDAVVSTSQVDATYSARYGYSAEGSSLLRTKLVPLPPPPVLEERIRRQIDAEVERRRLAAAQEDEE